MKKASYIYTDRRSGSRRTSKHEAVVTTNAVNERVDPAEFEFDKLGLRPGDTIFDRVMGGVRYSWKDEFTPHEALQETGKPPVSIDDAQQANSPEPVEAAREMEKSDETVDETTGTLSTTRPSTKWVAATAGILLIAGLLLYMRERTYRGRRERKHHD